MLGRVFESDQPDEGVETCEGCDRVSRNCEVFSKLNDIVESDMEGMLLCEECYESAEEDFGNRAYAAEPELNSDR